MITYPTFHIDQSIHEAAERAMVRIAPVLAGIDETTDYNQQTMMAAFAAARVSESHFAASTGYGYGAVSYTQLDVYKRQGTGRTTALPPGRLRRSRGTSSAAWPYFRTKPE